MEKSLGLQYFGISDYIVLISVLGVSSGIGLYYRFTGGKQKTFKEYVLADQNMSIVPVAFSLMASFMSAITILGVSKENYVFGTQFVLINVSYLIATPIVCYFFFPVFYHLQKTSVYEYLELRFGKLTRLFASLAFSLQMILYMGIVLFAPALALSAVTGISVTWSIIAIGVVCTFYSSMGGMKAVLVTDVFQSFLMFAAVFAVITKGLIDFGFKNILLYARQGDRLEFFKSLRKGQQSLWLQWIILTCLSLSTSFTGLVLYAQYRKCDPQLSGIITNSDQILPLYVVQQLGHFPGLPGLFVSGIFSGSLSTVSSALNSLAAVSCHDYIMPLFPSIAANGGEKMALLSKLLTLLYGLVCIGVAFLAEYSGPGVLQAALTIFGSVGGPLLALFTLGMICRCVGQKGAFSGLIVGLIFSTWIGFGQPKPSPPTKPLIAESCPNLNNSADSSLLLEEANEMGGITDQLAISNRTDEYSFVNELYAISYMWVATLGFSVTVVVANVVSWLFREGTLEVDKVLLSKFVWKSEEKVTPLPSLTIQGVRNGNEGDDTLATRL